MKSTDSPSLPRNEVAHEGRYGPVAQLQERDTSPNGTVFRQNVEQPNGTPPPDADAQLRGIIFDYVLNETDRDRHNVIRRLYELWEKWNVEYFDGLMTVPIILLDEPGQTRCYGMCSTVSGFGCSSQIQLRPSILDGTLKNLRHGSRNREGLQRFLEDVLLHEMIHQWAFEVTGWHDDSYSGHGPAFSSKANEIGDKLGLPRVGRTCKKRDRKPGEESPSQWPHDVRPDGYYLGAHVPTRADKKTVSVPIHDLDRALDIMVHHYDAEEMLVKIQHIYFDQKQGRSRDVPTSRDGGEGAARE